jgi:hypothetical protein
MGAGIDPPGEPAGDDEPRGDQLGRHLVCDFLPVRRGKPGSDDGNHFVVGPKLSGDVETRRRPDLP